MPIEVYSVVDGQRIDGDATPAAPTAPDVASGTESAAPGATDSPPAGEGQPPASPAGTQPAEGGEPSADGDDEPLRDDSEITAARLERRFKRLTAARRQAERERDALAQQHQVEIAQLRGQQEALTRMFQGAVPPLPETPAEPTGPPQAEQFASHEDYVLAAARYGAREVQQERDQQTAQQRQQAQAQQFQRDLFEREQTFKQAHPDFDSVVNTGLRGKVSPVLQQALMLVPDGPAVAYTLASQPELVQRLNSLPPPLVLLELGRLSGQSPGTPPSGTTAAPQPGAPARMNGTAPALSAPESPLSGSGGGSPVLAYNENMSQEDFRRWRARTSQLPAWKER